LEEKRLVDRKDDPGDRRSYVPPGRRDFRYFAPGVTNVA
jgi:hypothetical protein